ncbi:uncharacterized protein LOC128909466 [Rissa tridactyla]|uniref:uncharacterized protein LOC128909466 n=1 Tax=Rissa tridactyla TaxID=75485 RepID=UPI0023BB06ED|nr:uncharacterized protein LOC128909466 [Rissa tridactyla]
MGLTGGVVPAAQPSLYPSGPGMSPPKCICAKPASGTGTAGTSLESSRERTEPQRWQGQGSELVLMSSLPSVPLLGAREVTLGRNLAPLVYYYRIKLPFKAEPVLSGLHTIREHRCFPTAPTHFLLLCSRGASLLPALGTARGTQMGGDLKRSLEALFPPWESWKQREKASHRRGRALLPLGYVGKKEQGARAGSNGRAGGLGCAGAVGGLPSPGEGPGMLPSLWLGWGPPRGDRPLVPTGETPVHGQGGGVGLAAVRPPHESTLSICGRRAGRKRAGVSFQPQPLPLVVPNPEDTPHLLL